MPRNTGPLRLLFVFAHPGSTSLGAAALAAATQSAEQCGHSLRITDLYATGFDPVLTTAEHSGYASAPLSEDLTSHVDDLTWAQGVIFVYPTWWSAQPAVLKGWIDRVWRPGVGFSADTPPRPLLTHIRYLGVITTMGLPWWHWTVLLGSPGRKMLLRGLRFCTGSGTRTFFLALHRVDTASPDQCRAFLDRIRRQIRRL